MRATTGVGAKSELLVLCTVFMNVIVIAQGLQRGCNDKWGTVLEKTRDI